MHAGVQACSLMYLASNSSSADPLTLKWGQVAEHPQLPLSLSTFRKMSFQKISTPQAGENVVPRLMCLGRTWHLFPCSSLSFSIVLSFIESVSFSVPPILSKTTSSWQEIFLAFHMVLQAPDFPNPNSQCAEAQCLLSDIFVSC